MTEALLYLLPLLALLFPLLRGRFVGERAIAVLRERLTGLPPRRPRDSRPPVPVDVPIARGPQLLGTSLAVRPPPGLLLT